MTMNPKNRFLIFLVSGVIASVFAIASAASALEIASSWNSYYGLVYKGANHGIVAQQEFEVFRGGKKIGKFIIFEVDDNSSKGTFKPDDLTTILKDGDQLKNAGGAEWTPGPPPVLKKEKEKQKTEPAPEARSLTLSSDPAAVNEDAKAKQPEKSAIDKSKKKEQEKSKPSNKETKSSKKDSKSYPRRIVPKDEGAKDSKTAAPKQEEKTEKNVEKKEEEQKHPRIIKYPKNETVVAKAPENNEPENSKRFGLKVVENPAEKKTVVQTDPASPEKPPAKETPKVESTKKDVPAPPAPAPAAAEKKEKDVTPPVAASETPVEKNKEAPSEARATAPAPSRLVAKAPGTPTSAAEKKEQPATPSAKTSASSVKTQNNTTSEKKASKEKSNKVAAKAGDSKKKTEKSAPKDKKEKKAAAAVTAKAPIAQQKKETVKPSVTALKKSSPKKSDEIAGMGKAGANDRQVANSNMNGQEKTLEIVSEETEESDSQSATPAPVVVAAPVPSPAPVATASPQAPAPVAASTAPAAAAQATDRKKEQAKPVEAPDIADKKTNTKSSDEVVKSETPNRYGLRNSSKQNENIKSENKSADKTSSGKKEVASKPAVEKKATEPPKVASVAESEIQNKFGLRVVAEAPAGNPEPKPAEKKAVAVNKAESKEIAPAPAVKKNEEEPPKAAAEPKAGRQKKYEPAAVVEQPKRQTEPEQKPKTASEPEKDIRTAEKHLKKADEHYSDRDYHLALEQYSTALTLDPTNERARTGVMDAAKKLGMAQPLSETAEPPKPGEIVSVPVDGKRAQSDGMDISSVQNNYGVYQIQEGNYDEAIVWLTKAISENPNIAAYYRNRAVAYYKQGNAAAAVLDAKIAYEKGDERARELLLSLKELLKAKEAVQSKR